MLPLTFLISSLINSLDSSLNTKFWIIKFLFKDSSSKSFFLIKDMPKPISLDIENWLISSGLYENSFIQKLFTGEIKATSIFRFSPINSTRFLCWLFLPDKQIFPFL